MDSAPTSDPGSRIATYRVQLRPGFGFGEAAEVAGYLAALGVSHLYSSPALQAAQGSSHGYDVVDPGRLNAELGGAGGHARLTARLAELGLGQVLDIVPNHMAVGGRANAWWWDVLEHGAQSRYADYFDIDWDPPQPELAGLVLVPVLGDHYGRVLEGGELTVRGQGQTASVHYHEHELPLARRTLDGLTPAAIEELNTDPDALDALLRRQNYRLAHWRTAATELNYRRFFDITTLAGVRVEDPQVFADTHRLILDMVRDGAVDGLRIDHVDGLADPAGYLRRLREATGGCYLVVEKILEPGEGLPESWPVAGTSGYDFLTAVNQLFVDEAGRAAMLGCYERFTGQSTDYAGVVRAAKLQVMRESLATDVERLTGLLARVCEGHRRVRDFSREQLRDLLHEVLAAFPVYRSYARPGHPVTQPGRDHTSRAGNTPDSTSRAGNTPDSTSRAGNTPDSTSRAGNTPDSTSRAGNTPDSTSRAGNTPDSVAAALAGAARRRPDLDGELLAFTGELLTGGHPGGPEAEFAVHFAQVSAPVMAKGVEDTAFYRYQPLISLCEVGGDPGTFGRPVTDFHAAMAATAARWPQTMLTLATHDTKRSADVRARISLLAELPEAWEQAVTRWAANNERHKRNGWPDRNTEYLLYQTLVGAWPIDATQVQDFPAKAVKEANVHTSWASPDQGYDTAMRDFAARVQDFPAKAVKEAKVHTSWASPDQGYDTAVHDFAARVQDFMAKAVKEAKVHTSWASPDPGYDTAVRDFVAAVLADQEFIADLERFLVSHELVQRGRFGSLAQVTLLLTCPGVPDIYQGSELWDLSLVDPDNRRPVDFAARERLLAELASAPPEEALRRADEGGPKLWLIHRILRHRRRHPGPYGPDSGYQPLPVTGHKTDHVVAFGRAGELAVVVPRLLARLGGTDWGQGAWGDTAVTLPGGTWTDVLTGEQVSGRDASVGTLLRRFPVAVLGKTG